ncbi:hypothetical protein FACS189464_1710 [Bacteroidia bacterium]|nr:hypothetical protein FACS189464_1710 [Bacteroidia bacterium]
MNNLGSLLAEDANPTLEQSVLTEGELEGALNEAAELEEGEPAKQRVVARINRGAKAGSVIPTSDLRIRAEYSLRAHLLPDNIREALAAGRLKVVNQAFYRILAVDGGSKQFELMLNADTKKAGVTNVNGRKLEESNFFLLTSIILQSAALTGDAAGKPELGDYDVADESILSGEFSLRNGDKIIVQPSSARIFDTKSFKLSANVFLHHAGLTIGEWKLDNPKFISPQTEIIPELKLNTGVPNATAVKIILVGAGLSKA